MPQRNIYSNTEEAEISQIRAIYLGAIDFILPRIFSVVVLSLTATWVTISWLVYVVEFGNPGARINSFGDSLWWGIVTFLTIGYGDMYPITTAGRVLGSILMVAGVLSIGIITAKTSSYFLKEALLEGRGYVDKSKLRNHFVICGWKDGMQDLLLHILGFNPDLTSDKIVLLAHIGQEQADDLKSNENLKDLKIIVGDYFQQATLKRAAPERARKIMILADRSTNANGQVASAAEADARTIMTAISLSKIARETLVTAEIIDAQLDHYLQLAGVTEIIYSREYSRLLLGNASRGTGISNVFYDILNPNSPGFISTVPIAEELIHKSYADVKLHFEQENQGELVIGVLENSGNPHHMKELALKEAQKTAEVQLLIDKLHTVKTLRCNRPLFNPPNDYVIGPGAAAIVISHHHPSASVAGRVVLEETTTSIGSTLKAG